MCPDGRLVVLTIALNENGEFGYRAMKDAMVAALDHLVRERLLRPEELRRMAIPVGAQSEKDFRAPFFPARAIRRSADRAPRSVQRRGPVLGPVPNRCRRGCVRGAVGGVRARRPFSNAGGRIGRRYAHSAGRAGAGQARPAVNESFGTTPQWLTGDEGG